MDSARTNLGSGIVARPSMRLILFLLALTAASAAFADYPKLSKRLAALILRIRSISIAAAAR